MTMADDAPDRDGLPPDPYAPAPSRGAPPGRRWMLHQQRRASILAAARRLLARRGYDGVAVQQIAAQCGITKQTIYNVVGSRDDVMEQASAEWVELLARGAPAGQGGGAVFATLYAFWNSAVCFPEYTQRSVQASCATASPLNSAFRMPGTELICRQLRAAGGADALRPGVDPESFAWQLTEAVHAGVCRWATAPYDIARYRRDFACGPALMLLGGLRGVQAAAVEREVAAMLGEGL